MWSPLILQIQVAYKEGLTTNISMLAQNMNAP